MSHGGKKDLAPGGGSMEKWKNQLYFGDNLGILREHIPVGSVDLVYLDPPFNSQATYNVLFAEKTGEKSAAQITAFEDTWHWGEESEAAYDDVMKHGPRKLADLLQALRAFLGQNDMMAYLTMMAVRLVEMHRVLKPTGSLYLHCDPTAGHYLKLIMDAIFGVQNYRNEISWKRTGAHGSAKRYGPVHDIIFFYTKSNRFIWNYPKTIHDQDYIAKHFRLKEPETGRLFQAISLTGAGVRMGDSGKPWREINPTLVKRHWALPANILSRIGIEGGTTQEKLDALLAGGRIYFPKKTGGTPRLKFYLDELEGMAILDMWFDIPPISAHAKERLGYPTQKPEALLERIIRASSNEGDLVLDPFCGCGTALVAAERLKRRWIGIDITHLAIALIRNRLHTAFGRELSHYEVIGLPVDLPSAEALAAHNRHQFELWALGMVEAQPARDRRKGPDTGLDGVLYFQDDRSGRYKKIVVQVKSGHVSAPQVRDLKAVVAREKAALGALLTLRPPTRPMREEAAAAGFYEPEALPGLRYPRLQILTIAELFAGKTLQYPRLDPGATFKQAPWRRKGPNPQEQQGQLL
jgi:site-specific DNA-methyltransferase (adenine-specific)